MRSPEEKWKELKTLVQDEKGVVERDMAEEQDIELCKRLAFKQSALHLVLHWMQRMDE